MPDKVRVLAFCWMVESFSWLTHTKFNDNLRNLESTWGFDLKGRPHIDSLLNAAINLSRERQRFIKQCEHYQVVRRVQKANGQRQPPRDLPDPRHGRP